MYECCKVSIVKRSINEVIKYIADYLMLLTESGSKCKTHDILLCLDSNKNYCVISKLHGRNTKSSLNTLKTIQVNDLSEKYTVKLKVIAIIKCEYDIVIDIIAEDNVKAFVNTALNRRFKTFLIPK